MYIIMIININLRMIWNLDILDSFLWDLTNFLCDYSVWEFRLCFEFIHRMKGHFEFLWYWMGLIFMNWGSFFDYFLVLKIPFLGVQTMITLHHLNCFLGFKAILLRLIDLKLWRLIYDFRERIGKFVFLHLFRAFF